MIEIINNKYQPQKVFVDEIRSVVLSARNTSGSKRNINISAPSDHMITLQKRRFISFKIAKTIEAKENKTEIQKTTENETQDNTETEEISE